MAKDRIDGRQPLQVKIFESWPDGDRQVGTKQVKSEAEFWNMNGGRKTKNGDSFELCREPSPRVVASKSYQQAATAATVAASGFNTLRDLGAYKQALGPMFEQALLDLRPGERVLDGGGEGSAWVDLLAGKAHEGVEFRAVSAAPRDPMLCRGFFGAANSLPDGQVLFGYLGCKNGEVEKSLGEGTFTLIADVMGAIHYAKPDDIMASYGRLLRQGGRLFIHANVGEGALSVDRSSPTDENKGFVRWLESIKGFRVASVSEGFVEARCLAIELERTADKLEVPPLKLLAFHHSTPPVRTFTTVRSGSRART